MPEKLQTKFGKKLPWLFSSKIRIPRLKYPSLQEGQGDLPNPAQSLILIAIYTFLFWLTAGGLYIYIRQPIALGADSQGNPLWLYPSTSDAFVIESFVAASIIYLAGFGFLLLYNATKHAFNYAYAIKLLILGLILTGLSFGMLQWMMNKKINPS